MWSTFNAIIGVDKQSNPWSNNRPRLEAFPVFLACLPSQLSRISLAYHIHKNTDSKDKVDPFSHRQLYCKAADDKQVDCHNIIDQKAECPAHARTSFILPNPAQGHAAKQSAAQLPGCAECRAISGRCAGRLWLALFAENQAVLTREYCQRAALRISVCCRTVPADANPSVFLETNEKQAQGLVLAPHEPLF